MFIIIRVENHGWFEATKERGKPPIFEFKDIDVDVEEIHQAFDHIEKAIKGGK